MSSETLGYRMKRRLTMWAEVIFFSTKTKALNKDVILLRLDGIGDYILFRNFIEELHKSQRDKGKLILCGNIIWKSLAEKLDGQFFDECIWIDVPKLQNPFYKFSVYKKLRKTNANILVQSVFSRTPEGDDIAMYSGAKEVIAYEGDNVNLSEQRRVSNNKKFTKLIPSSSKNMFEFFRNKEFFEKYLGKSSAFNGPYVKIEKKGSNAGPVVIFPGAGHENRRWSPANFAELCKMVYDTHKLPVVICGSARDKVLANEIIQKSGMQIENYTGKMSLYENAELISTASLVITNDSGPFHIAAAVDVPVVCISNGNNYGRFCPYPENLSKKMEVVFPDTFEEEIKDTKKAEELFGQLSEININLITPEKVLNAIKKVL